MKRLTGKASDFLKIAVAAAGQDDLDAVRDILAVHPEWLHRIGSHGRTMLWEAAWRGRERMVGYLADYGADIEARGCHFTPLLVEVSPYCAARVKKHAAAADALKTRGALYDIYTAAYLGDSGAVAEHLAREPALVAAEVPQHDPNVRATVLHYAVAAGQLPVVRQLLERRADPKPYGYYLIRFCIWRKRADILAALLDAGLDPDSSEPPRSGLTDPAIIALLEAHGVQYGPDHAEGGWPPLVFQCRGDRGGNIDRVRALLDSGADVDVRNHKGQTALHCAARAGFVDIVTLLLAHDALVDARDSAGETPLTTALRSTVKDKARLLAVVDALVTAGADRGSSRDGKSPSAIAGRKRDADRWIAALGLD